MKGGLQQLLRQANQMQSRVSKLKEEMAQKDFEATAGGSAVHVTVTGEGLIKNFKVDPSVLESGDTDMLQDLLQSATNQALKEAKETREKEIDKITGGMSFPGML